MDYNGLYGLHGLNGLHGLLEYMDKILIIAALRSSRLVTLVFRVIMEPGQEGHKTCWSEKLVSPETLLFTSQPDIVLHQSRLKLFLFNHGKFIFSCAVYDDCGVEEPNCECKTSLIKSF